MQVAKRIAEQMNAFRLAFKTYHVNDLNKMLQAISGEGSRIDGDETGHAILDALLQRGFTLHPKPNDAEDGYVRIIRTNSIVGNLLSAFEYVGPNGDDELARLLVALKRRPRNDDLAPIDEP